MKDKYPANDTMFGIEFIAAERQRQIEEEGYTTEKDQKYNSNEELALAASCYALPESKRIYPWWDNEQGRIPVNWPWGKHFWKPNFQYGGRIRELAKAGALIAAEIDRLLAAEVTYTDPDKHYAFVDGVCQRCAGSGEIGGVVGIQACPECNGTGHIGSYKEVPPIDPSKIPSALVYRLRKTREQRKVGLIELAKIFGWSVVHLSDIERGRVEPTPEEREQIKNWVYTGE